MIQVDEKEVIRRAYLLDGKSLRQIAKERHHSRRTVAIAVSDPGTATYRLSVPRPAPVLDAVKSHIDAMLQADQGAPKKQHHTARRIYTRLVEEHQFGGAESTVRHYVGLRRTELERPAAYLLLNYAPGMDAQCDFGEAEIILAGQPSTVQLFCLRLCYSKAAFVYALPHQRQEAFLEGHQRAFEFFGGVPHHIWYDNLKTAVQKVLRGHHRDEQPGFTIFRSHHLFESRFCNPREGHEKGLVENLVGYARRNFLVPVPEVATLAELNANLALRCRAEANRRLQGETQTIGDLWATERAAFLPLPTHPYQCCRTVPARVNRYSLVTFETNRYSAPAQYAGQPVLIKAFVDRIEIVCHDRRLATHVRCYDRERDILISAHFLRLILERPAAWDHAQAIQEWRARWPAVYDTYLAALRKQLPEPQGIREFVRILMLQETVGEKQLASVMSWALAERCYSCEGVLRHLRALGLAPEPGTPSSQSEPVRWQPVVTLPNLAQYQQLVVAGGPHGE
jgi:transposase